MQLHASAVLLESAWVSLEICFLRPLTAENLACNGSRYCTSNDVQRSFLFKCVSAHLQTYSHTVERAMAPSSSLLSFFQFFFLKFCLSRYFRIRFRTICYVLHSSKYQSFDADILSCTAYHPYLAPKMSFTFWIFLRNVITLTIKSIKNLPNTNIYCRCIHKKNLGFAIMCTIIKCPSVHSNLFFRNLRPEKNS
jgi:hypothetical protein